MAKITWVSSEPDREVFISIDKYRRLYISSQARDLLRLPEHGKFKLVIGYDVDNKRLIAAKPDHVREPDVRPFNFDKRGVSHAKALIERMDLSDDLPIRYKYVGKDYAETVGAYAFEDVSASS